ncbi:phosphatase PAP2 family protein [Paraburkholderia sp. CNPSo 3274]|uniref:phosphatase PAP2 family protein n=1 Tax=Paraburkholderia sp. CNPSo 3274 TaxID=2940932 RepID=UPI0020B67506|nr:phosphatase PAP2 family protein [Paraburkholderia sp. CNPSo 3274]MCP3711837.1 phosphatase PAP2 family protein [Paraburkholderia sp. CNPSo 3274]
MNSLDTVILGALTQVDLPPLLNHAIRVMVGLYTFKGYFLIPLIGWIWFQPSERREWRREMMIATVASGLIALAVGRLLARCLPFRQRPIFNPDLHLHFASSSLRAAGLTDFSSFPSDHAMLWLAIAVGIYLVWRVVGALAILYTVLVICLPRAYLGYHYPTDLIAGGAIGVVITWLMTRDAIRKRTAEPALRLMMRFPGPAAASAFLVCFELVTQFDDLLRLAHSVVHGIS